MAITLRAAGAWGVGTTSVTPALPAGIAAGDLMIMFVGCKPYTATINVPAGWTLITGTNGANGAVASGIDTGSVQWAAMYRSWATGDAAPAVSITSGNVCLGVIHGFTPTSGSKFLIPVGAKGSDTSSDTAFSLTMDANFGIAAGDMLVNGSVIAGNNSTFGTPVLTAAGATFSAVTESPATEGTTANGNDLEASAYYATCSTGPASAAAVASWTLSIAQTGGGSLVRLREYIPNFAMTLLGTGT